MPQYSYRVKNESGKIFTGQAKADKEEDLKNILIERGYMPLEIREVNALTDISQIKLFQKKVKIKDLAIFCRQFAIILEAGIPISACMEILKEQTNNSTLKRRIVDIGDDIKRGISLSSAMRKHEDIFPEILINMVEAGEVSGQLDKVFSRMAEQFERDYKLVQKVKGAMVYPIIVLFIAFAVVFILMTFVVPTFSTVLEDLGAKLPIYTRILLAISNFFKSFWWAIIGGLILLVVGTTKFLKTETGKRTLGRFQLTVPVLKKLTKNLITARFTRNLATLIASGVLLIQSLEVVQKVLGNKIISEKLEEVVGEIKKGRGLSQPIANMKFFPPMVMSMIRIGEESGDLDYTLVKCADFYDQEVDQSIQELTQFIEPLIIIFLAGIVGFVMLGILTPMFEVYKAMSVD